MSEQSPYSSQYQPPVQPVFAQPPPDYSLTITKGEWFLYIVLQMIPVVNLVMLIVYALDNTKPSRANLAKVNLILLAVGFVIAIGYLILFLCFFGEAMKHIH